MAKSMVDEEMTANAPHTITATEVTTTTTEASSTTTTSADGVATVPRTNENNISTI